MITTEKKWTKQKKITGRSFTLRKDQIPPTWLIGDEKLKTPNSIAKINIEFVPIDEHHFEKNNDNSVVNVKQDLMDGFKEIIETRKKGIKLPNARDLLKEL